MTEKDYLERKNNIISEITCGKITSEEGCYNEKCAKCKGCCCERYPCILSPKEFLDINDMDYMKNILDTGILTIASLNMTDSFYCIRPRGINDLDTVTTGYVMGVNSCILQSEKGCILDYLTRPTEGLLLLPGNKLYCIPFYSDKKLVDDWYNYQSQLYDLRKIYKDKEIDKPKATSKTAKIYKLKLLNNDCKKETN